MIMSAPVMMFVHSVEHAGNVRAAIVAMQRSLRKRTLMMRMISDE